jgi:2-polyprenyl-3-methyl-5-hydroxy-6-metoxy-1,4-benzoquinol methylase
MRNTMPTATAAHADPWRATHAAAQPSESLSLEFTKCCICGVDDYEPLAVGEDFEYATSRDYFLAVQCRRCGLVYLNPRPAASELERIYPPEYHAFDFSAAKFGLAYRVRTWLETRRLLASCRALPPAARILDIGCGDGFHLSLLAKAGRPGWTLEGVDASWRAVQAGRERGLTIHHGTLQALKLPAASYDVALLIATLEHVDDPPGVLRAARGLLKPGGRLVVVTDNTGTPDFALFKRRHWGGYHFPRHWNLFNRSNLRQLAKSTGFEVERIKTVTSPVNWVYSLRNLLVDWRAPAWLVERFSLRSAVSLGIFTVTDRLLQLAGHGALLKATLRRPIADASGGADNDNDNDNDNDVGRVSTVS